MHKRLRMLWTGPAIALVLVAGGLAFRALRVYALDTSQAGSALPHWWRLVLYFYGLIFVIVTVPIIAVFSQIKSRRSVARAIANAFISCLFFGLAAITGDHLSLPALSSVGLASLNHWLFGFACVWSLLALYFLLNDEDKKAGLPQ